GACAAREVRTTTEREQTCEGQTNPTSAVGRQEGSNLPARPGRGCPIRPGSGTPREEARRCMTRPGSGREPKLLRWSGDRWARELHVRWVASHRSPKTTGL